MEIKEAFDILLNYLINRRCPESLRIKLKPMKEDARNFQRLIDNKIHDMEETQMFNNYKLFMKLLREPIKMRQHDTRPCKRMKLYQHICTVCFRIRGRTAPGEGLRFF